jgi:hypothetical protein
MPKGKVGRRSMSFEGAGVLCLIPKVSTLSDVEGVEVNV